MRAETKQEPVIGIPLVARIRPVVVQPDPVGITFHVEHVQVAVGISIAHRAVRITAYLIPRRYGGKDWAVFYA